MKFTIGCSIALKKKWDALFDRVSDAHRQEDVFVTESGVFHPEVVLLSGKIGHKSRCLMR